MNLDKNYWIALLASLFLMAHLTVIYATVNPSLVLKYLFPLAFLIFGILLVKKKLHTKPLYALLIIGLSVLSIMSHEGSFVFPIVFILFDFLFHRRIRKEHLFFIIPAVVYLLARLFYFGAPSKGFMQVDLLSFTDMFPKYMDYAILTHPLTRAWNAVPYLPSFSISFFLALFLICAFFINKKRYLNIGLLFFSILILMAPFSVLINHFLKVREIWAVAPTILFIIFVAQQVDKQRRRYLLYGALLAGFCVVGSSNVQDAQAQKSRHYRKKEVENHFKSKISKQLIKTAPAEILIDCKQATRLSLSRLAGILSTLFPIQTFIIKNTHDPKPLYFIKNGLLYRNYGKAGWKDWFQYPSEVQLPEKAIKIKLKIKKLEEILKSIYSHPCVTS